MNKHETGMTPIVIPDACTLPTAQRPLRVAQFEEFFTTSVRSGRRVDRTRLRLDLEATPAVAGHAAELLTRETACCSFFTFTLSAANGELVLEVSVPQAHTEALDAMAGRVGAVTRARW